MARTLITLRVYLKSEHKEVEAEGIAENYLDHLLDTCDDLELIDSTEFDTRTDPDHVRPLD